jgi:hypothetical protein
MKGRWIIPILLLVIAAMAWAVDFPAPPGMKTILLTYSSYSWDNAKGWVRLPKTKVIRESIGPDGLIISREISYGEDILIEVTRYEYSEKGHRKTTYNVKNEVMRTAAVEKTPDGIKETIYAASGAVAAVYETSLDPRGLPLRSVYRDAEGGVVWNIAYAYENGECTEITYANPDGSTAFSTSYSYDERDASGNWIQRTETVRYADIRERPKDVVRRSLEAAK